MNTRICQWIAALVLISAFRLPHSALGASRIEATVTLTNTPGTGALLQVNGQQRFWTNNTPASTNWIITTNSPAASTTNLYAHVVQNPFTNVVDVNWLTRTSLLFSANYDLALSLSVTGGWATITLRTNYAQSSGPIVMPYPTNATELLRTNQATHLMKWLQTNSQVAPTASGAFSNLVDRSTAQTISGKTLSGVTLTDATYFNGATILMPPATEDPFDPNVVDADSNIYGFTRSNTPSALLVRSDATNLINSFSSNNALAIVMAATNDPSWFWNQAPTAYAPQGILGWGVYGVRGASYLDGGGLYLTANGIDGLRTNILFKYGGGMEFLAPSNTVFTGPLVLNSTTNYSTNFTIYDLRTPLARITGGLVSNTLLKSVYGDDYTLTNLNSRENTFGGSNTISGDMAFTPRTWTSLANGANAGVSLGTNVAVVLSGAAYPSFAGFTAGRSGEYHIVQVNGATTNAVLNESGLESTAANRILTGIGADLYFTNSPTMLTFIYDSAASRWRLCNDGPRNLSPLGVIYSQMRTNTSTSSFSVGTGAWVTMTNMTPDAATMFGYTWLTGIVTNVYAGTYEANYSASFSHATFPGTEVKFSILTNSVDAGIVASATPYTNGLFVHVAAEGIVYLPAGTRVELAARSLSGTVNLTNKHAIFTTTRLQ